MNFCNQEVTEGVYATYANAVQTAGNLVAVFVELTTCMEDGENNFQGAGMFLLMHTGRDTAAVVAYAYGVVFQNLDINVRAEAGHRFIYTVVHHLIYQMMKTSLANVSDVH